MPKWVASRLVAVAGLVACWGATAGASQSPTPLAGVVVVGQRQVSGTPASIDSVRAEGIPARAGLSVSEWLRGVAGVAAHDRQNLAQDVQLTVRGFGARSAFGVRGLQLVVDGIPATMPDGQGQVSHVPLAALARVEVLRGPFSALYGNASGGVIAFSSSEPPPRRDGGLRLATGSDDMIDVSSWVGGPWTPGGDGGYRVDADRLELGGFRDHSRARRDIAQARLLASTRSGARVALTLNAVDLHADDPQGLTREQAERFPRMASAGAIAFDTRKRARQEQAGLRVEQALGERALVSLSAWTGTRTTFQVLSVPVTAQAAPGSGGGVVDLARDYGGADLRWRRDMTLGGHPASLTLGAEGQQSREHRRGFENFVGGQLGVVGALRRDQRDRVASRDVYAEARWMFRAHWTATLGMRHSRVDFDSRDAYIAPGNPDDSGALHYRQTTPVVGLLYQPAAGLDIFANAGRGFETPSLSELAYRSDGRSGLNTALQPARSNNAEVGARLRHGMQSVSMAAFASRTRDELVVASNSGGRSTYSNAATGERRGWELSAAGPLSARWDYAVAYARLDAHYANAFVSCRAPPCTVPDTVVASGNRIPATAPQSAWARIRWQPRQGMEWFAEGNAIGRMQADDANTAWAPGHATLDLGVERRWTMGGLSVRGSARVDNVLDRRSIGSVIVNDSNGRFFEPAPGRGWTVSVSVEGARASP
jgi:iron complex outermembrane receptor protein